MVHRIKGRVILDNLDLGPGRNVPVLTENAGAIGGTNDGNLPNLTGLLDYAVMSVQGGSTGEATVDATPRKIAAWNTDGVAVGAVPDHTNDAITITNAGLYLVMVSICFSGTASKTYDVEIYKNAAATGFALQRVIGTGGDVGSASVCGIVSCAAADEISLYQSTPDVGLAFTAAEAQLVVARIPGTEVVAALRELAAKQNALIAAVNTGS